jgi:predicted transcriptional regulator
LAAASDVWQLAVRILMDDPLPQVQPNSRLNSARG